MLASLKPMAAAPPMTTAVHPAHAREARSLQL
jgi:hypothetical protein